MNEADQRRWKSFCWKVAGILMAKGVKGQTVVPIVTLDPINDKTIIVQLFNQGALAEEVAGLILQRGIDFMLVESELKPT